MKYTITNFYKTQKGYIVINFRDKTGFITELVAKPRNGDVSKEVILDIIKDFRFCMTGKFRHTELRFDIDKEDESVITYFETWYGWDL